MIWMMYDFNNILKKIVVLVVVFWVFFNFINNNDINFKV